jgi:hypothetical protein
MTVFPTIGHPASWAAICPGNRESAGYKVARLLPSERREMHKVDYLY